MPLTAVLFDLDGTLLPMDQDVFINEYFKRLAAKLAPAGYESDKLFKGIWAGIGGIMKNNSPKRNEEVFWEVFRSIFGEKVDEDKALFDEFYRDNFGDIRTVCGFNPEAASLVRDLKAKGLRVVLATNPFFPAMATHHRIRWTGLEPDEFELVTTYENSCRCKPDPAYYEEVLNKCGLKPDECIMVGNDALEDTVAETLGMRVFLLTDCLINKQERDISQYPQGSFKELRAYINEQLK